MHSGPLSAGIILPAVAANDGCLSVFNYLFKSMDAAGSERTSDVCDDIVCVKRRSL